MAGPCGESRPSHGGMSRGLFITGTDTGVGKTCVAAALLRMLAARRLRAVGMKPVAAGFAAGTARNADVDTLVAAGNVVTPASDVNPFWFAPAIAPHLASVAAGVTIDLEIIAAAHRRLAAAADVVIVEGAGGALVPLSERHDMLDIPVRLGLPVLMVVGIRLGCLNHALLTAQAINARGLRLAGWVANRIERGMTAADGNVAALVVRLEAPLVADIPWRIAESEPPPLPENALRTLDLIV